mgnify:CR=1 FL=1
MDLENKPKPKPLFSSKHLNKIVDDGIVEVVFAKANKPYASMITINTQEVVDHIAEKYGILVNKRRVAKRLSLMCKAGFLKKVRNRTPVAYLVTSKFFEAYMNRRKFTSLFIAATYKRLKYYEETWLPRSIREFLKDMIDEVKEKFKRWVK